MPDAGNDSAWPGASAGDEDDIWGAASAGPKPMDRREFRPKPKQSPTGPDFVKSHLHMPAAKPLELPPFDEDPYGGASSLPVFGADSRKTACRSRARPTRGPPCSPDASGGLFRGGGGADLLAEFKLGARLPQHALASRVPGEVAQELGAMMLLVVEQMSLLLKARASAKALVRSQDRTIIGALDNNPMKFMADPGEALEAMLSKERTGYLDGMRALREAFEDIKSHEMATYAAMQKALSRLLDDLSPEAIESKVSKSAFSNNKAKAWETFVQRWEAKVEAHENGMLDVFLLYFAEAYKEASGKRRR